MLKSLLIAAPFLFAATAANASENPPITLPGEPVVPEDLVPGTKAGDPLFDLPSNMRVLSAFGERANWSPDGKKIAFVGKAYGDAYEYELATGKIRNITAHAPNNGFLRVQYLADGSLILLGPRVMAETPQATRHTSIEMFWMSADATQPPMALGVYTFEGVAMSATTNRVAWTEAQPRAIKFEDIEKTVIKTGVVEVDGNSARLVDVKTVVDDVPSSECYFEPQNFLPGDKELTMPCYSLPDPDPTPSDVPYYPTRVALANVETGELRFVPTPPNLYTEVEGMFPDGKHTLVECSVNNYLGLDLCMLELTTDNPSFTRLTRVMDYGRWRFSNPVVSPDSKKIALQIVADAQNAEPGAGEGILLIELD